MAKKRVHEIAKAQGVSSKELLAALKAAGVEAKAAASSVEEADALKAIQAAKGNGGAEATPPAPKPAPPKPRRKAEPRRAGSRKPPRQPQPPPKPAAESRGFDQTGAPGRQPAGRRRRRRRSAKNAAS